MNKILIHAPAFTIAVVVILAFFWFIDSRELNKCIKAKVDRGYSSLIAEEKSNIQGIY
jgi:hypothetical protein